MELESTVVQVLSVDSIIEETTLDSLVQETTEQIVVQPQEINVVVTEQPDVTVVQGQQQGQAGPPGDSYTYLNVLAGANLNGHIAVNISIIPGNQPLLGITTGSASIGDLVEVQQTGYLTHIGWNWVPLMPIYALDSGTLTQVLPLSGDLVIAGYAVTPTKIYIKQEPAILLG